MISRGAVGMLTKFFFIDLVEISEVIEYLMIGYSHIVHISKAVCRTCLIVRCDGYTNLMKMSMALSRIIVSQLRRPAVDVLMLDGRL